MNNEPTPEQIKEFWERCGFQKVLRNINEDPIHNKEFPHHWLYPDGTLCGVDSFLPTIDLNNLFKYMPKLREWSIEFRLNLSDTIDCMITNKVHHNDASDMLSCHPTWRIAGKGEDKDPALALFWACYKAFGEGGK